MQQAPEKSCSASRCGEPASKHVRFGNRSFGTTDIPTTPNQNYTAIHRNLCDTHVENVLAQYLDVEVFELNACPSCR
jgi:hypothetical protein